MSNDRQPKLTVRYEIKVVPPECDPDGELKQRQLREIVKLIRRVNEIASASNDAPPASDGN